MHAFQGSQGREAVNTCTQNKAHETFGEEADVGFPCRIRLFEVKKGKT